jgi:hypothetical protein
MNKNGSVMLTFFPAVGQRKYDYTKKQVTLFFFCSFMKLVFPVEENYSHVDLLLMTRTN